MLQFFDYRQQRVLLCQDADRGQALASAVWVDVVNPSLEEVLWLENTLNLDIPTREEVEGLELSNRLYQESGVTFVTMTMVTSADTENPQTAAFTFVIMPQQLITLRYAESQAFTHFIQLAARSNWSEVTPMLLLFGLLEAIVNRLSDVLEKLGSNVDTISREIFRVPKRRLDLLDMVRAIGANGDLASKVKESLISKARLASYLQQVPACRETSNYIERMQALMQDITALNEHAGFLANKVSFLLDATLGMINIQQNGIIKIFSVAAVVFLPPTLIASIYGMNFEIMPELTWLYGYPMALLLMVIFAVLPYYVFKRKGWL